MAATVFLDRDNYGYEGASRYQLLPFRFDRRSDGQYFLANEAGEYLVLSKGKFDEFRRHELSPDSKIYFNLKAKHFLADDRSSAHLDVLASKCWTKKSFISGFTKLHIFVTSLRCNQSCPYCQVSRQGSDADAGSYDMSFEVLERSVQFMLAAPAKKITMEFQGGDPFVNFDLLTEAIRLTNSYNQSRGKEIDFVVCTNLSLLEDRHLTWCQDNGVSISTSLDGPEELHNRNRPLGKGKPSHSIVVRNIRRAQEALGKHAISALMTTTRASLESPKEIIDEYLRLDLGSIFIRELNPYGFAIKTAKALGYSTDEFLDFYREVLDYVLKINREGRTFSESLATMILTKLLTPWPIGFVDLQSPSGVGTGVCVYNYDGDVCASDESRMLAEVNDYTFRLGNVMEDSYRDIFFGETMQAIASASCNEALAGCSDCAYQSFCGADPVRHWATQKTIFGNRGVGDSFCKRNMGIIKHMINLVENADKDNERIFWAWIMRDDVNRLRL